MKKTTILLTLALLLGCLGGCAGQGGSQADGPAATLGRTVVVDDSGVIFWGYESYLCSGLLDEAGEIYDIVIEAQTTSKIRSLAICDGYIFLDNDGEGIFRYGLEEIQTGTITPQMVTDDDPNDGFEIFDDQLYYEYGGNLYQAPVTGGAATAILRNIHTYSVTADGIYFTSEDGGIYRLSLDGAIQERLVETDPDCHFCLAGDKIFYRCEENDQIYEYAMKDGTVSVVNKLQALSDTSYLWATDQYLLYRNDKATYQYDRSSGEEKELCEGKVLPDKHEGFWVGDTLYAYDQYRTAMYTLNLDQRTLSEIDMEKEIEALVAQAASSKAPSAAGTSAASSGFDITAGLHLEVVSDTVRNLSGNHFTLSMPAGEWDWEKNTSDSVTIYYIPAKNAGYGGDLVTIQAYDPGDTSYQDLPAWALAGQDGEKTYIAIFPTDLRYDPSDAAQKRGYTALLEYVKLIDSQGNPFRTV